MRDKRGIPPFRFQKRLVDPVCCKTSLSPSYGWMTCYNFQQLVTASIFGWVLAAHAGGGGVPTPHSRDERTVHWK